MTERAAAAGPSDPYRWNESVLSTRSLSYVSSVGTLGNQQALPSPHAASASRNNSHARTLTRAPRNIDGQSEYETEMETRSRRARLLQETLPPSVAHSLLFALPQEIRDRIYTYCLVGAPGLAFEWPSASPAKLNLAPQLLRTCKAIFAEAAPLLYMNNTFSFAHPSDANVFVRAMVSPLHAGMITTLNLHLRAQDLRLWMSYLTSTNETRSLKADFLNVKEVILRYKTNRWAPSQPAEVNIRHWPNDRSLDEIVNALRHTFYPIPAKLPQPQTADGAHPGRSDPEQWAWDYLMTGVVPDDTEAVQYTRHPRDDSMYRTRSPIVKVIYTCRIHISQFLALTNTPAPQPQQAPHPAAATGAGAFGPTTFFPQLIQNAIGAALTTADDPPENNDLAREGETFRGYDLNDFQGRARRVQETNATYNMQSFAATTVFSVKNNIQIAFELFAFDQPGVWWQSQTRIS